MAAATDYASVAQQLYIAYFGRPADYFGLQGMESALLASGVAPTIDAIAGAYPKNAAIKAIFDNFGSSAESVALYGSGSDAAFINSIYMNVLNRSADLPGLNFWVQALGNGSMTRASAAVQIMAAASTPTSDAADFATTGAKTTVATNFTNAIDTASEVIGYSGNTAAAQARAMLATVTGTTDTVAFQATVDSTLNSIANPPPVVVTSNLTVNADNLPGTTGNDNFVGTIPMTAAGAVDASGTLTAGDVINGGVGQDTLSLSVSGSVSTAVGAVTNTVNPNIKGVEKVLVSNVSAFSGVTTGLTTVVDLSLADSGLTGIGTNSSTTAGVLTKFTNVGSLVAVEQAGRGNLEVGFSAAAVAGTTDTLSLTVTGVGSAAIPSTNTAAVAANFKTAGIETLTVNGNGTSVLSVDDNGLKTVNVAGSGSTTISFLNGGVVGNTPTVVNAAAATGVVTIKGDGMALATTTVTGGAGTADAFFTNDATITASSKLANVKGFEVLGLDGVAQTATLDAAINGLTTIDTSSTNAQTVVLAAGFTGNTAVVLTGDGGAHDSITATASNVALTVTGNVLDLNNTTIAGGTGVDTLKISADSVFAQSNLSKVTGFDAVTILANANDASKAVSVTGLISGTSGKTLTVDASALTNSSAALTYVAGTGAGKLSLISGAGADVITGSNSGDTIVSGAGADTINAGSGADSLNAGDGNDTVNMGANLTSADTIDGGSGTDTLVVDSVAAGAFTNVTNIENVQFSANATTISLATPLSANALTLDLSNAAVQSLTLATGFTGATTVKIGTGDTVINTAGVALTVTGTATQFNGDVITGGTGIDTLNITADGTTANLSGVATSVETINVLGATTLGVATTLTGVGGALSGKVMTIDASTIVDTTAGFTVTTGASTANGGLLIKGAAGVNTINMSASVGNTTVVGGGSADVITASTNLTSFDSISGGAGNDTITFANAALTFDDTVDGGAGTDILVSATTTAIGNNGEFAHVTNVETLRLTGAAGGVILNASSPAFTSIDIGAVTGVTAAAQSVQINQGYASAVNVVTTGNTAANIDTIINSGNVALTVTGKLADIANAGEIITGGSGVDTLALTADSTALTLSTQITGIEQINVATATVSGVVQTASITLVSQNIAANKTLTVDASSFTNAAATFVFNAGTETGGAKVSVTGGGASDTITGGSGNDTINGNGGNDVILSGGGNDILNGGSGNDVFVAAGNANKLTFATITDFTAGDAVKFAALGAVSTTVPAQLTLNPAATLSDYIDAALATGAARLVWFQTGGNTYMVGDYTGGAGFNAGADQVIQINGLVDLSASNIASNGTDAYWQLGSSAALPVAFTYTGTAGTDTFLGSGGNDTFTMGATANLAAADTISGFAGTDTISVNGVVADAQFTKVTSVEILDLSGASTVTLGAAALAAGLTTITNSGNGNVSVDITGYGSSVYSLTTGTGGDTITVGANLSANDTIAAGTGADTLKASGTILDAAFTKVTGVETLDLTLASTVTLGALAQAAGVVAVTDSGAAAITINASAYTVGISLTGGAAADVLTGGTGADTISGTTGLDTITGGAGGDAITIGALGQTVKYTALAQTLATAVVDGTTNLGTGGADVITFNATAADTLKLDLTGLSVAAITALSGAITVGTAAANELNGLTGVVSITNGAYTGGVFTAAVADGTHKDLLVQWDTNGATAGGVESIVIVGSWTAAIDTAAAAAGVLTVTFH